MTREESRVVLASIHTRSANIDEALEGGLCCPECGSTNFMTLQREETKQPVSGRQWGQHEHVPESQVTIGLACDDCERNLWGESVNGEAS